MGTPPDATAEPPPLVGPQWDLLSYEDRQLLKQGRGDAVIARLRDRQGLNRILDLPLAVPRLLFGASMVVSSLFASSWWGRGAGVLGLVLIALVVWQYLAEQRSYSNAIREVEAWTRGAGRLDQLAK